MTEGLCPAASILYQSLELILSLDVRETKMEGNKGKSYIDPSPTSQPRAQSKEQPRNQSKGPKEEGKLLTHWFVCVLRERWSQGWRCKQANRARAFAVRNNNVLYKFKKKHHVSGRSLSALCPAIPLSVHLPMPGARENLLG